MLPAFDHLNALSIVAPAMYHLAERISECAGFQRLNDELPAVDSAAKVAICSQVTPWDMLEGITIEQLENQLLLANIALADSAPLDTSEPESFADAEGRCSIVGFTLEVAIFRQIRESEYALHGADNVYLQVTDCLANIAEELRMRSDQKKPIIRDVRLAGKPLWNEDDAVSAQGRHIWAILEVDCGDRGGSEQ